MYGKQTFVAICKVISWLYQRHLEVAHVTSRAASGGQSYLTWPLLESHRTLQEALPITIAPTLPCYVQALIRGSMKWHYLLEQIADSQRHTALHRSILSVQHFYPLFLIERYEGTTTCTIILSTKTPILVPRPHLICTASSNCLELSSLPDFPSP